MSAAVDRDMLIAARDACEQVAEDFIQEARDYRDAYAPLSPEARAQVCDEMQTARYWRSMSRRFARALA